MSRILYFFLRPTYFEKKIGYKFKNRQLLKQALTHRSYRRNQTGDNERLEYLGDSVLNLILSDLLMKKYPEAHEGTLSKIRSSLVSTKGLHKQAQSLNIIKELELRFGRKALDMRGNSRLLASFLEALMGALYLDAGYTKTKKIVTEIFEKKLNQDWEDEDYKTILQGKSQKKFKEVPTYNIIKETGFSNKKTFIVQVLIQSKILGQGKGSSKKNAEQNAAEKAIEKFDEVFKEEE